MSQKVVDPSFLVVCCHILVKAVPKYDDSIYRSQWLAGLNLDKIFVSDNLIDFLLVKNCYWEPMRLLDIVISFSETN